MKKGIFLMVALFALPVLAQVAPAVVPAPAVAMAVAATPSILDLILSHLGVISAVGVAILDLVFALNPKADAPDGLLHMIYLLFKSKAPPAA